MDNFSAINHVAGYDSEFDSEAETERKRKKHKETVPLLPKKKKGEKIPSKRHVGEEYNKEEGKIHRQQILSLDAFSRHKLFVNNYLLYYGGSKKDFQRDSSKDKRDIDVIRENHQFLWEEEEEESELSWEKRLTKKYYDKLFKEYCIADVSRYKENKFGMRWRIEKEVCEGKGQFICGAKKCNEREGLKSWEVNFGYIEHGEKKNALVKLRLCPDCSYKLNYHHKRTEVKPKRLQKKTSHSKKSHKDRDSHRKRHGHDKREESKDEDDEGRAEEKAESKPGTSETVDDSIWSGPAQLTTEKLRSEEFDEYFDDMFL